ADLLGDLRKQLGAERMLPDDGLGTQVIDDGAVRSYRDATMVDRVGDLVQPARRPPGDERDKQTRLSGPAQRISGSVAHAPVRSHQRAVQVTREQTDRHDGSRRSRPPSQGRSAWGT